MIDVKQAVSIAIGYFRSLMGDSVTSILLEEAWPTDDEKVWYVTLSAVVKDELTGANSLALAFSTARPNRIYKVLTIDATDGTVKAMKIRHAND